MSYIRCVIKRVSFLMNNYMVILDEQIGPLQYFGFEMFFSVFFFNDDTVMKKKLVLSVLQLPTLGVPCICSHKKYVSYSI